MLKGSVLVVDNDQSFRTYITSLLCSRGYEGEALATGDQLIGRPSSGVQPSVILLDVLLPDGEGIEVMRKIQAMGVIVPVIMLSGTPDIRTVVEAMKLGAVDFLQKAFDDSALEQAIEIAVGNSSREHVFEPAAREPAEQAGQFVTRNAQMRRLTDIIKRAARTDVPILILGESGDIDHGHVFNADGFLVFGQGAGVIASSLHPGFVATRFGDEGKGIGASGFRLLKHLALTPEEGAKTMIFLASASRSHSQEKQNKRLHNR